MANILKSFIKRHKFLLKVARFILRRKNFIYSWNDVNLMTDDWCRFLPDNFDCVIGIPRSGLMIADLIALNFGLPLSTPDNFMRGIVWQSKLLRKPLKFKRVLIIDDCVDIGRDLLNAKLMLCKAFPEIVFEIGALVLVGNCLLNYCYLADDFYITQGVLSTLKRGVKHGACLFDDFI